MSKLKHIEKHGDVPRIDYKFPTHVDKKYNKKRGYFYFYFEKKLKIPTEDGKMSIRVHRKIINLDNECTEYNTFREIVLDRSGIDLPPLEDCST